MADKTELNYDEMQAIVKRLQNETEALNQLFSQTKSKVEGLHGTGWVGRGSNEFFQEMESRVLPSFGRLINALQQSTTTANKIMSTYHQAEDQAQNNIKSVTA